MFSARTWKRHARRTCGPRGKTAWRWWRAAARWGPHLGSPSSASSSSARDRRALLAALLLTPPFLYSPANKQKNYLSALLWLCYSVRRSPSSNTDNIKTLPKNKQVASNCSVILWWLGLVFIWFCLCIQYLGFKSIFKILIPANETGWMIFWFNFYLLRIINNCHALTILTNLCPDTKSVIA